jgi:protein transport protein HofQ
MLFAKTATISLVVDDVPVTQVLQALAEQENRNMIVSPEVSGNISLRLTKVPWAQAMQTVAKSAGLVLREEKGIYYVNTAAWQQKQQAGKEAERNKRAQNTPLQARSIPLSYADAGDLQAAAEKLLSARGSLAVDKRTNRLLVRDGRAELEAISRWVEQMDLPVAQVELAAHIVTISEKSLRELGVKWNLAEAQQPGKPGQITTLSTELAVASATGRLGFNIGRINGRLLDIELSALEQKQQLEIIASPRLLASHMQLSAFSGI